MPPNDDGGAKALSPTSDPNALTVFGLNQAEELLVTADIACVLRRLPDLIPWFVNLNLVEEKKGHGIGCTVIARPFTADNAASCDPQSLVAARSTILTGCFHQLASSTPESKKAFLLVLRDADECVAQEAADELNPDELRGLLETVASWKLTDEDTQEEAAAAIEVITTLATKMHKDKRHAAIDRRLIDALFTVLWADNKKNPGNDPEEGCPHDDMVAAALELFMALCDELRRKRRFEFKKLFTRIFTLAYIEAAQTVKTKRQECAFRALCLIDPAIARASRSVSGPGSKALFKPGEVGAELIDSINSFRTPDGASAVEIYVVGCCGTGKSSFIRTLMWLLLNDKTAKWHHGAPFVSTKPKASVTTGLHRYKGTWKGDFVVYDSKGIEHARMDHIQSTLTHLADGMVPIGHDTVEWKSSPQPHWSTRAWRTLFPLPKQQPQSNPDELTRPQVVLLFINANASNLDVSVYRDMIETVRGKGVLVQVVITKSADKAAREALKVLKPSEASSLQEPRCLGLEQNHESCSNCTMDQSTGQVATHVCGGPPQLCTTCRDQPANLKHHQCCGANACEEMYWRDRLGEPDHVYIIEPFREEPNARQNDFFDLGVHNVVEILTCVNRALQNASDLIEERQLRAEQLLAAKQQQPQ